MIPDDSGRAIEKPREDGGCFFRARLTLPYNQHLPAKRAERSNRLIVTLLVS